MTKLSLGGTELTGVTSATLDEHIARALRAPYVELWLERDDRRLLCMLKSGERALLLFMEEPGAVGRTSRSDDGVLPSTLSFRLDNGQIDEYPAAWTIPVNVALEALRYFCDTGELAPFVRWA